MNFQDGNYLVGEYIGFRTVSRNGKTNIFLGVQFPVTNGYEGQTNVVDVKLSNEAMQNDAHLKFANLMHTRVAFPINTMSRAYNERVYSDNYLDIRRQVIPVDTKAVQK